MSEYLQPMVQPTKCWLLELPRELFLASCTIGNHTQQISISKNTRNFVSDRYVNSTVLSSYLTYRDFMELDLAFLCNKRLRSAYLQLIQYAIIPPPMDSELNYGVNYNKFLHWIFTRKLKLSVCIVNSFNIEMYEPIQQSELLNAVEIIYCSNLTKYNKNLIFYFISQHFPNLKSLIFDGNEFLNCNKLKKVLVDHPKLQMLSLNSCKFINDLALQKIAKFGKNLRKLNLSKTQISSHNLLQMISNLPNITSLDLSFLNISFLTISEIIIFYKNQLKELFVNNNFTILLNKNTNKTLLELNTFSNSLQLYGRNLSYFSISETSLLKNEHLQSFLQNNSNLIYLNIANCTQITNDIIYLLSQYCHNLQYLDCRNCHLITNEAICCLAQHCRRLVSVHVDGCIHLTNEAILAFGENYRKIVTFTQCAKITL